MSPSTMAMNPMTTYFPASTFSTAAIASSSAIVRASTTPTAASSTPTTTSTASTTPGRSHGVSNGTLAGAIVGSIAGTALLVLLAAWLFFRRSRQNARSGLKGEYTTVVGKAGRPDPNTLPATGTNAQLVPGKTGETVLIASNSLSKYIPEPAGDETVVQRVLEFFDQATLHVDNYYSQTLSTSQLSSGETPRISDFDSPYLPGSLTLLLENPRTRRLVITHTLVHSLLQEVQPHSATRDSLLPSPFAIGPLEQQTNNSDKEFSKAFHDWRMLTSYLSQSATPEAAEANSAVQDTAIYRFVESFTSSFAPYADPSYSRADRVRHLKTVTATAADLGQWLFGQPCAFDFVYTAAAGNEIVVLPEIVKVSDEKGQHLASKVVLCDAVTAKL